jgi:hypothetical protein
MAQLIIDFATLDDDSIAAGMEWVFNVYYGTYFVTPNSIPYLAYADSTFTNLWGV